MLRPWKDVAPKHTKYEGLWRALDIECACLHAQDSIDTGQTDNRGQSVENTYIQCLCHMRIIDRLTLQTRRVCTSTRLDKSSR